MFLVLCCTCDPRKTVETIMLRVAGTGMLALSRNELFAATQTIAADPDDPEAEVPGEAWHLAEGKTGGRNDAPNRPDRPRYLSRCVPTKKRSLATSREAWRS